MRRRVLIVELDRRLEFRDRRVVASLAQQRQPQIVVGFDQIRFEFDRLLQDGD